jgi:hypothetical protein
LRTGSRCGDHRRSRPRSAKTMISWATRNNSSNAAMWKAGSNLSEYRKR